MARSFNMVDFKCAEAEFFLDQIPRARFNFFGVQCFVSAFASAARSIATAMQASLARIDCFHDWYNGWQERLRNDPLANFFHAFRNANQHMGENAVGGGSSGSDGTFLYWFIPTQEISAVPSLDVYTASRAHFVTVLSFVYDCYLMFGPHVDAHQHYTAEHFESLGKSIEDAEEELGFPRGWTDVGKQDLIQYRWQALRRSAAGCEINHLFQKDLGKITPGPPQLAEPTSLGA